VPGKVLLGQLADVHEKWVMWGQLMLASPRLISFEISFLFSIHLKWYDRTQLSTIRQNAEMRISFDIAN
jgi:hypothetical protein